MEPANPTRVDRAEARLRAELNARAAALLRDLAEPTILARGKDPFCPVRPTDLRLILRDFLRGHARAHGRTPAEQVAAFARMPEDRAAKLFADLFVLAVGFDVTAAA